jgi:ATP synthase protein I
MSTPDATPETGPGQALPAGSPVGVPPADTVLQIRQVGTAMLRGGLWPGVIAGVAVLVVAVVLAGGAGLVAALLGVVLVLVVCALGPLVMRWTASAEPLMVMGIAMISFVTKFGLLAVVFLVLQRLQVVDTRILALAIGVTAIAFITGETVAFARARVPTITAS